MLSILFIKRILKFVGLIVFLQQTIMLYPNQL